MKLSGQTARQCGLQK